MLSRGSNPWWWGWGWLIQMICTPPLCFLLKYKANEGTTYVGSFLVYLVPLFCISHSQDLCFFIHFISHRSSCSAEIGKYVSAQKRKVSVICNTWGPLRDCAEPNFSFALHVKYSLKGNTYCRDVTSIHCIPCVS